MSASEAPPMPSRGRARTVIENVTPRVDGGRFAIKRVLGEAVAVEADAFCDGHDSLRVLLLHRHESEPQWRTASMHPLGNDRWRASFSVERLGSYCYTIEAAVDHVATWQHDLEKKQRAGQDVAMDLRRGAQLARAAAARAAADDARRIGEWARALEDPTRALAERAAIAADTELAALAGAYPHPELVVRHAPELRAQVDRVRARFSTWYELFPRSTAAQPGRHGSFADVIERLPYVASMGFDVLYLPPIHPIGRTERKGPNNRPGAAAGDPGSPWGIGASEGGHKSVHPELGTLEDFRRLRAAAERLGMEIALDIAFQCSPDHPYVTEHPEWFLKRPDGTIQYAENPPKKYQDIYPFDFESEAWRALWTELRSIFEFWLGEGVRIFRVDNPHTKPFALWEWIIESVRREHPGTIFLSEAFTRPKVMYRLAKLGFTQSYTYFAWRNTKAELTEYFTELASAPVRDFFRANLWPNTPDILTEYLQFGGRAAFMVRLVLAATLGASYGIYGPAFELLEHRAREPGGEEYLDSEKYQLRHWDLGRPDSLRGLVARLNAIRREHAALQTDRGLRFHRTDNDTLIAYSKTEPGGSDAVLVIANLDPHHLQSGWVELDLQALGLEPGQGYQAHDLLSGARFLWQGPRNFVSLDPAQGPAHVIAIRRRVRSERDFDYFL